MGMSRIVQILADILRNGKLVIHLEGTARELFRQVKILLGRIGKVGNLVGRFIIFQIGLNTARDVLDVPRDMLVQRADLEEETIDEVLKILSAEFEE